MAIDVVNLHGRRAVNRWDRVSVGDTLERLIWSYPDKEAIVGWAGAFGEDQFERLTYRQADELANRVANGLLAEGMSAGDRVLLFCENSVEAYLAKIAIAKAGLVAVPLNPSLAPEVVAALLKKTEPVFSIVDAELWPRAEAPLPRPDSRRGLPSPSAVRWCREAGASGSSPKEVQERSRRWKYTATTSGRSSLPRARQRFPKGR